MATLRSQLIVSALLFAFASVSNAGSIQKWVDAQGKVHYGDRPPTSAVASVVKIRKAVAIPADKRVDVSPQAQLERLLNSKKRDERLVSVISDEKEKAARCGPDSPVKCIQFNAADAKPAEQIASAGRRPTK
jgi:hypothetical protein